MATSSHHKKSRAYAVFETGAPFKEWHFDLHDLGPRDLEVKITHCGVCHSDLHTVQGDWPNNMWPAVVGHEIVGYVTEVGPEVKNFHVGQRVGVGPQALACFKCKQCQKQSEIYCPNAVYTYTSTFPDGYISKGGYAEFHRVDERFCFDLPESLPSAEVAPLLCAGMTVYSPLKHFGVKNQSRVAVIGIGGLGHLAVQYAAALGADVTAVSTSDSKRDEVTKLGAKQFINSKDPDSLKKHYGSFDFILCAAAGAQDWENLVNMLDVDGTFCNVGAPGNFKFSLSPQTLLFRRLRVAGSLVGSPKEYPEMLQLSAERKILPFIEKFPLEKVNEAAKKVVANQVKYRAVLEVDPNWKPSNY